MPGNMTRSEFLRGREIPLAIVRIDPQRRTDIHAHEFSELVIIYRGSGIHVTGSEEYRVQEGDVFVISGDRAHGYRDSEDFALVNILFDPHRLAMPRSLVSSLPGYHVLFTLEPGWRTQHRFESRLRLGEYELSHAMELVTMLGEELGKEAPGYALMAQGIFMQLVGHLARCYGHTSAPESALLMRLAEVLTYLARHYAEPVELESLARRAHMSVSGFLRAFKRATGTSPIDYLIQLRVRRAGALLRSGEANVTEAAFRVGFSDSNYFSRQFRRVMGLSPREYVRRGPKG